MDGSHSTQAEIVKAISDGLGTGKVHVEPKESALLNKELSVCQRHCVTSNTLYCLLLSQQCHYDHLMLNIQLEGLCVKDSLQFVWVSEVNISSIALKNNNNNKNCFEYTGNLFQTGWSSGATTIDNQGV